MANNVFQAKRTTVSGRTPNTTGSYATNTQYIAAGEFALNMADGILYSSNGTTVITVGANLVNQNITGNLTVKAIIANSSLGTAGQVLTTNSTGVYWSSVGGSGTVTSVATGNGMTGGPITTTGTVSILANNGIIANSTGTFVNGNTGVVVNSTGVFVNATYIGTISANNANNLGGVAAASYVQNTDSKTLSGNLVISGTSFTPSSNTILLGNSTQRWVLSANTGSFSGAVSGITTLAAGNTTLTGWASAQSVIITGGGSYTNGSIYSDANWGMLFRASRGSPTQAQYAWKSTDDVTEYLRISPTGNVGIGNTAPAFKLRVDGTTSLAGAVSDITTLAAGNTTITGFANVTTSVNSALFSVGTSFIANTTGAYHTGTVNAASHTVGSIFIANSTQLTTTVPFSANGGTGTSGQVLTSNGATGSPYWATAAGGSGTVTSVATGNGMTGGPITTTGTVSILANTGVVANATGTFVNATYIATISANNASFLDGTAAASYVKNTDSRTLSGSLTFTGSNLYFISSSLGGTSTNFVNNFIINTSTVGNQSILRTYHYRHTTGADWTGASTRIQQRIDVTDMAYLEYNPVGYAQGIALYGPTGYGLTVTIGGQSVFSNNVILGSSGLSANGGFGTAGQVLTTNGTAAYWSAAAGGGYYKGGSAAVGSLAVGGQNLFRVNANTLNTNTTFVAGENAQATGPISVASGITLTVESGARVSIV